MNSPSFRTCAAGIKALVITASLFCTWIALPAFVFAGDVAQPIPGHGKINYSDKKITVTGSGAPSLKAANAAVARLGAERAAKMDAFRNILEAVKGVKVSGTQTAGSIMAGSNAVKSKIEGVIRNFEVLETKYYSDGGVDLVVSVPLNGITAALLSSSPSSASANIKSAAASGATASGATASGSNGVTGIIINARGLKAAPGLAPKIIDAAGKTLFEASMVRASVLQTQGATGYRHTLKAATKDARVGAKPLVLKALRSTAKGSVDLILGAVESTKLASLGAVMAAGKLVIVID